MKCLFENYKQTKVLTPTSPQSSFEQIKYMVKNRTNSFPVNDMYRSLAIENILTTCTLWLVFMNAFLLMALRCLLETSSASSVEVEKCLARIVVIFKHLANILCCLSITSDNDRNDNTTAHHLIYHFERNIQFICISAFN